MDLWHQSGEPDNLAITIANIAIFLDRISREEAAAILFVASDNRLTAIVQPELAAVADRLHQVLGATTFDHCTREGASLERADLVRFARAQIDEARDALTAEPPPGRAPGRPQ